MRGFFWRTLFSILTLIAAAALHAGQPGQPPVAPADGGFLNKLLEDFRSKPAIENKDGIGPRGAQAALCNVCLQPLHKHGQPGWEGCVPIDPETGLAKKMQRIISVQAMDPVSGIAFTAALPGNQNSSNGVDRDNCWHSVGKTAVFSNVWISPDSGYAAWIPQDKNGATFQYGLDGKPLSPDIIAFVKEKLSPQMEQRMKRILGLVDDRPIPPDLKPVSQFVLQTQIPDWIKYDFAIQIYERMKAPHAFMARLYHEGAMACRREISSEVAAPALDSGMQENLSKSIRTVNYYMLGECMGIRRDRGSPIMDPRKPETDPEVISLAARRILEAGKRLGIGPRMQDAANNPRQRQTYFNSADMFLCNIILAGAQNRLGNSSAADRALSDALLYVPEQLNTRLEDPELERLVRGQLQLLRQVVTERQECLKKEQEWLFKSAQRSMFAVKAGEIKFKNYKDGFKLKETVRQWDPAQFSYLTGELLRRSGENAGAKAWFNLAEKMIDKHLANIEAAEKANPPVANGPDGTPIENPYEQIRADTLTLKMWNRENQAAIKNTNAPDPFVNETIQTLIANAGLTPADLSAVSGAAPKQEGAAPAAVGVAPRNNNVAAVEQAVVNAAPAAAVAGGGDKPKTREELYKLYYKAIMAYRGAKKENPRLLKDLVAAGFISPAQSCLNGNQLICPEKGDPLFYMRMWEAGDGTFPVISKPGQLSLYADGSIKVLDPK